jgi:hypothetical protein
VPAFEIRNPEMPKRKRREASYRVHSALAFARAAIILWSGLILGDGSRSQPAENSPGLSPALGWHEIPNTRIETYCPQEPSIQGVGGCRSVIDAWNGGVADLKRERLIIWGGGHTDYYGNEVYALDLRSLSMSRLTEPSPVTNVNDCPEAYPDGRPSSRHTYGGLTYDPIQDAMFTFGGSKSSCGAMSTAIWKLGFPNLQWSSMEPHRGEKLYYAPGITSEFDPNTGVTYVSDRQSLFRYNSSTDTLTQLVALPTVDYHLTAVIDAERKLFLMMGGAGQLWSIEIGPHSKHAVQDWSKQVKGCDKLLHFTSPGLAYDPQRHLVVGWGGGNSVVEFDTAKMSCTEESFPGGPGTSQKGGTWGRFRYFPSLGVFVIVNDWKQNAYYLRLSSPDTKRR